MSETKMVVGLGNPGRAYMRTRHNAGFWVLDALSEALGIEIKKKKFGALLGSGEFADKKLILLKPQQFMNCSGQVVAMAVGFYKLERPDLLVVSDDMALEVGRVRIRSKGSAGGQKGLADIIEKLGTTGFSRLRVGIGKDDRIDAYDYVLNKPGKEEKLLLEQAVVRAKDAVICWIREGISSAMNKYNCSEE